MFVVLNTALADGISRELATYALSSRAMPPTLTPHDHTCAQVDIVHTNLPNAADLLTLYQQSIELHGPKPDKVASALAGAHGGFWDVMMIGTEFSYSVTCSEYVELASDRWNVLLCREAEDAEATRCGEMTRYTNGTLSDGGSAFAGGQYEVHLDRYYNYMGADVEAAKAERVPIVRRMLSAMLDHGTLHAPRAAEALRTTLLRWWPGTSWQVLIEKNAGPQYYYSEEQFNFDLRGKGKSSVWRKEDPLSACRLLLLPCTCAICSQGLLGLWQRP